MGKRTREAKAKAAAEAVASTSAAPFLALEDKDEGLDAIFAKTYAPVEKVKPVPLPPAPKPVILVEDPKPEKKEKSKKRKAAPSPVPRDPDDPEELYIAKQAAKRLKAAEPAKKVSGSRVVESASEESDPEVEEEGDATADIEQESDVEDGQAQAEALAAESDSEPETSAASTLTKPPKSDDPLRDARTAFIGNLPLAAATNKALKKSLLAHLTIFTKSKIESIRYRSLPLASTEPVEKKPKPENHSTKRAKEWAEQSLRKGGSRTDVNPTHVSKDDKQIEEAPKVFLTPAQKRKVAFITGEHLVDGEKNAGASCNAYVVLSSVEGVEELIAGANGKVWEGRTLRVDKVEKSKKDWQEEKRTVFVGGLAFEEGEEALRKWMEATLVKEKGEEEGGWVQSVRIIRDKQTGLGKGFAYVLLKDKDCVDEVLALDPAQCKMDKRKLRFDRCKNAAKLEALKKIAERKEKAKTAGKTDPKKKAYNADAAPIKKKKPAADLGKELEGKPKGERKAIKSADIDRVQRRLEKKQKKSQELKRESRKKQRSEADLLKRAGQRIKGVEKGVKKGAKKPLKKTA